MKTIFTIILLLAAIALIIWVARPTWGDAQALRTEQKNVNNALATLKDLQKLRDDLLATYDSLPKDKVDRLEELLPKKPELGSLLVNLEKLTKDRGILLRRIEFSKESSSQSQVRMRTPQKNSTERAQTLSYSFTISANYEVFRSFLAALEKNLRIIDVSDIAFSAGNKTGALEISLKAKSYYQK